MQAEKLVTVGNCEPSERDSLRGCRLQIAQWNAWRNLFPWTVFRKPKPIMEGLHEQHSPVQAGNMPSESPLLPQLLWKLVKLVQSTKTKCMQNLSLKNWPYHKLQQRIPWHFSSIVITNEVVNPFEFLLEWGNILGHRTRQRQFWQPNVETNKPARRPLYCVASGRSTGYRTAPWKFPTIVHFPKYCGENYQ